MNDDSRRRRRRLVLGSVWAAPAILVVLSTIAIYNSFYHLDDFVYLAKGDVPVPGWAYLSEDNYQHFAPFTRLAYWVAAHTGGVFSYAHMMWASVVFVIALAASLGVLTLRQASRTRACAVVSIWLASVIVLRPAMWWGAAVHVLGALTFVAATLLLAARWVSTRRLWLIPSTVAAYALALTVQERPLLTPLYLIGVLYVLHDRPTSWAALARRVRADLALWVPIALTSATYLVYRTRNYPVPSGSVSPLVLLDFLHWTMSHVFGPALVGSTRPIQGIGVVVIWAAIGVGVGFTVYRAVNRGDQMLIWVWFTLVYIANLGLVGAGRLALYPKERIGADLQYYVEPLFALLLVAGATRLRPWAARTASTRVLAAGFIGFLVAGNVAAWPAFVRHNAGTASRSYFEDLAANPASRVDPGLVRTVLPDTIASGFTAPFNDLRVQLGMVSASEAGAQLSVVTSSGLIQSAEFVVVSSGNLTGSADPPTNGDGNNCATVNSDHLVSARLNQPVPGAPFVVRFAFRSNIEQMVTFAFRSNGEWTFNYGPTKLKRGGVYLERLDGWRRARGAIDEVAILGVAADSQFCLLTLEVGMLAVNSSDRCSLLDEYGAVFGRC